MNQFNKTHIHSSYQSEYSTNNSLPTNSSTYFTNQSLQTNTENVSQVPNNIFNNSFKNNLPGGNNGANTNVDNNRANIKNINPTQNVGFNNTLFSSPQVTISTPVNNPSGMRINNMTVPNNQGPKRNIFQGNTQGNTPKNFNIPNNSKAETLCKIFDINNPMINVQGVNTDLNTKQKMNQINNNHIQNPIHSGNTNQSHQNNFSNFQGNYNGFNNQTHNNNETQNHQINNNTFQVNSNQLTNNSHTVNNVNPAASTNSNNNSNNHSIFGANKNINVQPNNGFQTQTSQNSSNNNNNKNIPNHNQTVIPNLFNNNTSITNNNTQNLFNQNHLISQNQINPCHNQNTNQYQNQPSLNHSNSNNQLNQIHNNCNNNQQINNHSTNNIAINNQNFNNNNNINHNNSNSFTLKQHNPTSLNQPQYKNTKNDLYNEVNKLLAEEDDILTAQQLQMLKSDQIWNIPIGQYLQRQKKKLFKIGDEMQELINWGKSIEKQKQQVFTLVEDMSKFEDQFNEELNLNLNKVQNLRHQQTKVSKFLDDVLTELISKGKEKSINLENLKPTEVAKCYVNLEQYVAQINSYRREVLQNKTQAEIYLQKIFDLISIIQGRVENFGVQVDEFESFVLKNH